MFTFYYIFCYFFLKFLLLTDKKKVVNKIKFYFDYSKYKKQKRYTKTSISDFEVELLKEKKVS